MKKHYGCWMDIVRSLELESFILTKLTKHSVPVNLVGPQVSLPPRWVRAVSRSMRHDRRSFGRLEQEDQRLKKHYGRWKDIVRSLELESFILTKLTKPSILINLVGPQVSLPPGWAPASRGSIHFSVHNKEALPVGLS